MSVQISDISDFESPDFRHSLFGESQPCRHDKDEATHFDNCSRLFSALHTVPGLLSRTSESLCSKFLLICDVFHVVPGRKSEEFLSMHFKEENF